MAAVDKVSAHAQSPRRRRLSVRQIQLATALGALLVWEAAGDSGLFYKGVFPSVSAIAKALVELLASPQFYTVHLATTAYEVAVAFALGSATGLAVGLALGMSRYAGLAFEPLLYYVAPTPKVVFLPVLLVLFGIGTGSKIALGAVSAFFPMALSVASGVRLVSPILLRAGRALGMTRTQMLTKIYLPALRAPIGSGLRLAFGLAVVGSLLAELKLSDAGLGYLALDDYRQYLIAPMYAVILVVFALAAGCNALIGFFSLPKGPTGRKSLRSPRRPRNL